ncbi:MAG: hypothetical protein ABIF09_03985 [Gemmatimonadota bacterium]
MSGYFESWNSIRDAEMTLVAFVICLFGAAVGALGAASPSRLVDALRKTQTPRGLILLGALRVLFGMALLFAASASKAPGLIPIVGVIVILKGVTLPLMGVERVRKLLDWWSTQGSLFLRGWALLAVTIGLVLAYAVLP